LTDFRQFSLEIRAKFWHNKVGSRFDFREPARSENRSVKPISREEVSWTSRIGITTRTVNGSFISGARLQR
jgi:hypothetical protein